MSFDLSPILKEKHFKYITGLVTSDQVFTAISLDGKSTEPRTYHVSWKMQGMQNETVLAIFFRRRGDPVQTYFYSKHNGEVDWHWEALAQFDAGFDDFDSDDVEMPTLGELRKMVSTGHKGIGG